MDCGGGLELLSRRGAHLSAKFALRMCGKLTHPSVSPLGHTRMRTRILWRWCPTFVCGTERVLYDFPAPTATAETLRVSPFSAPVTFTLFPPNPLNLAWASSLYTLPSETST